MVIRNHWALQSLCMSWPNSYTCSFGEDGFSALVVLGATEPASDIPGVPTFSWNGCCKPVYKRVPLLVSGDRCSHGLTGSFKPQHSVFKATVYAQMPYSLVAAHWVMGLRSSLLSWASGLGFLGLEQGISHHSLCNVKTKGMPSPSQTLEPQVMWGSWDLIRRHWWDCVRQIGSSDIQGGQGNDQGQGEVRH